MWWFLRCLFPWCCPLLTPQKAPKAEESSKPSLPSNTKPKYKVLVIGSNVEKNSDFVRAFKQYIEPKAPQGSSLISVAPGSSGLGIPTGFRHIRHPYSVIVHVPDNEDIEFIQTSSVFSEDELLAALNDVQGLEFYNAICVVVDDGQPMDVICIVFERLYFYTPKSHHLNIFATILLPLKEFAVKSAELETSLRDEIGLIPAIFKLDIEHWRGSSVPPRSHVDECMAIYDHISLNPELPYLDLLVFSQSLAVLESQAAYCDRLFKDLARHKTAGITSGPIVEIRKAAIKSVAENCGHIALYVREEEAILRKLDLLLRGLECVEPSETNKKEMLLAVYELLKNEILCDIATKDELRLLEYYLRKSVTQCSP